MNPSLENDLSRTKNGSSFEKVSPQYLMTLTLAKIFSPVLSFELG